MIFGQYLALFPFTEQFIYYSLIILITGYLMYITYKLLAPPDLNMNSSRFKWIDDRVSTRVEEKRPNPYPHGWVPVIHSNQLKKNEAKPVHAFGKDLVVFRGSSGKCYSFDAYCPHLGANLGMGGSVTGETIKCPFHGWVFNEDGKCSHVPGVDKLSSVSAKLTKYETVDVNDYICVWHNLPGVEPTWFPIEMRSHMKDDTVVIYRGSASCETNGHIEDLAENAADAEHFHSIHAPFSVPQNLWSLIGGPTLQRVITKYIQYNWTVDTKFGKGDLKHTRWLFLDAKLTFFGYPVFITKVDNIGFGPYLSTVKFESNWPFLGCFYVSVAFIHKQELLTSFNIKVYSEPGLINLLFSKFIFSSLVDMTTRDSVIWANQKWLSKPYFVKNEGPLVEFRRWFKQFY